MINYLEINGTTTFTKKIMRLMRIDEFIIFRVEYEKRVRREAQKYAAEIVQKQMLGD